MKKTTEPEKSSSKAEAISQEQTSYPVTEGAQERRIVAATQLTLSSQSDRFTSLAVTNSSIIDPVRMSANVSCNRGVARTKSGKQYALPEWLCNLHENDAIEVEVLGDAVRRVYIDGWPIFDTAEKQERWNYAKSLVERELRSLQGTLPGLSEMIEPYVSVRRDTDGSSKEFKNFREKPCISSLPAQPIIRRAGFERLMALTDGILGRYRPESNAFVCLGNSPAPLHELLRRRSGAISLALPMTELDRNKARKCLEDGAKDRVYAHLNRHVSRALLQGRTNVVVLDSAGTGQSILAAVDLLQEFYGKEINVVPQILNCALNGWAGGFRCAEGEDADGVAAEPVVILKYLECGKIAAKAQEALLGREYKRDGYGLWVPCLFNTIAGGETTSRTETSPKGKFGFVQLDIFRYLWMIVDILRSHNEKYTEE